LETVSDWGLFALETVSDGDCRLRKLFLMGMVSGCFLRAVNSDPANSPITQFLCHILMGYPPGGMAFWLPSDAIRNGAGKTAYYPILVPCSDQVIGVQILPRQMRESRQVRGSPAPEHNDGNFPILVILFWTPNQGRQQAIYPILDIAIDELTDIENAGPFRVFDPFRNFEFGQQTHYDKLLKQSPEMPLYLRLLRITFFYT